MERDCLRLKAKIEAMLAPSHEQEESVSVLLLPTLPIQAPKHDASLLHPVDWAYCGIWNALELPATQIPISNVCERNLPVGVQLVGLKDEHTLMLAAYLEKQGIARSSIVGNP